VRDKFRIVTNDRASEAVFQRIGAAADTVLYGADAERAFAHALTAAITAYTTTVVPALVAEIVDALRAGGRFEAALVPGSATATALRTYPGACVHDLEDCVLRR
jgi:hypothetical protein